jgi:ATPase family AAA domain-containing protein 1
VKASSLYDKWVGESDKIVQALFTLAAKVAPCVIFIDEIDTILKKRGNDSLNCTSMMGTFLAEWDGFASNPRQPPVLVLGATNRPQDIDEAFLRRMPYRVQTKAPDQSSREAILKVMLRDESLSAEVDLSTLGAVTEGCTGSDLRELCRLAAINRLKRVMNNKREKDNPSESAGEKDEMLLADDLATAFLRLKTTGNKEF